MKDDVPRCDWCRHRLKPKPRGRPARFCSASCRQRAYERRQLEKREEAEAAAINRAKFPAWATHLHVNPKLPPRRRPRRLTCPVCQFQFEVKPRGPIPETCSSRCALALAFKRVYLLAKDEPVVRLNADIVEQWRRTERKGRHQAIINEMLGDIGVGRRR